MSNLKRVALLSMLALLLLPTAGAGTATPARGGLVEVVLTLDAPPVARGGVLRTLSAVQGSVGTYLGGSVPDGAGKGVGARGAGPGRGEPYLGESVPDVAVQRRYSLVLDGLAVKVPASEVGRLQDVPGVVGVYPSVTYHSLRSSSPGFIGAPALWGSKLKTAGQGVKIGIIDDGLDRTHPYLSA